MPGKTKLRFVNTWGTIPLGATPLQLRHVVLVLGVAVWIGMAFWSTNTKGIIALALNGAFLILVILLGGFTRTLEIATIGTIIFCGGFMMGVAGLLGTQIGGPLAGMMPVLQPLLEEVLKLLPVVLLLWRGRRFTTLTLGATDVLILGVASGASFAFVEDAFIHAGAWQGQSIFMSSAEIINGRMFAGHAIWTGLGAGTVGLALLLWHRSKLAYILAPIGIVWAVIDHIAGNYYLTHADFGASFLNVLTLNGYTTIVLFLSCLLASIFFDRYILFKTLPKVPEFRIPSRKDATDTLHNFWEFILDRRRLAYAHYRYLNSVGDDQRQPALVVAILMQHMINCHKLPASKEPTVFIDPDQEHTIITSAGAPRVQNDPEDLSLNLPDRYEVVSLLSQGGMGKIYKARHKMTGAKLAIKMMHPHLAKQQINILRFEQEARAASALKHPNLVVVHDFGVTSNDVPFLVMDLIEGTNVQEEIRFSGPLSVIRFCNIFMQVCDALSHAHKRGVIHRDIKPSNMILAATDEGEDFVRIVDFGIAKVITKDDALSTQELTQSGDLIGSPLYMSPEQCLGTPLDQRSDIYSLGCVMYEALTGKPAFQGANSVQTIFKHLHEMPPQPQLVRPSVVIPPGLEQVIFQALQKDPAARYQTMDELRSDIEYARHIYIQEYLLNT